MAGKRVLVFGTFDGLHPGHYFFLRSAKARGDVLVVGVARDEHVNTLKQKRVGQILAQRMQALKNLPFVDEVHACDTELGSFDILKATNPDLIVVGHDQYELEQDLIRWMSEHDAYIPMLRIKKI
ncbi:FAD synthase [Candidatus Uhrbacteria bacterium CG_4_9_14_3_um_filter_50_9]|uniref:FAD synthase n=1 Tax=Candidatus Uhrbacteria bacterium CG_4_9_14_3_um_filter_50_9 TaxID=1975035 RepID=A0A2M7XDV2_9BACT|nr:MAG: FAD synthase [Candidatus Uhrbacteria bacterium CG_4_9_14_3_um_filter_50_9]